VAFSEPKIAKTHRRVFGEQVRSDKLGTGLIGQIFGGLILIWAARRWLVGRFVSDKLALPRIWIVARRGTPGRELALFGVGIVLKHFAPAHEFPLLCVWIVLWRGSSRSVLIPIRVWVTLQMRLRRCQTWETQKER
jgi:hypothetical protein